MTDEEISQFDLGFQEGYQKGFREGTNYMDAIWKKHLQNKSIKKIENRNKGSKFGGASGVITYD